MTDIAIRAEGLGKVYHIGRGRVRYRTAREAVTDVAGAPFRLAGNLIRGRGIGVQKADVPFWALRDISLEIRRGDVLGIVGRNGAGKSTLLKVLSGITEPTQGYADIYGRVGSLLEVGTGFHGELTGRENVYLNGAILGMKRREIDRKFDEIVDFAEIAEFLDTPVKHYSSGMYMRLAFAVAAHLETEVLFVDEVLAVGDLAFQKKCLGKMESVSKKEGKTILFVSHSMGAVRSLCNRGCWLESGPVMRDGSMESTTQEYLAYLQGLEPQESLEGKHRLRGGVDLLLAKLEVCDDQLFPCQHFFYGMPLVLRFHYRLLNPARRFFAIEVIIKTLMGENVLYVSSSPQQEFLIAPTEKNGCVQCQIDHLPLASGSYTIYCRIVVPHQEYLDEIEDAARFDVVGCDAYSTGFDLSNQISLTTIASSWKIIEGAKQFFQDGDT